MTWSFSWSLVIVIAPYNITLAVMLMLMLMWQLWTKRLVCGSRFKCLKVYIMYLLVCLDTVAFNTAGRAVASLICLLDGWLRAKLCSSNKWECGNMKKVKIILSFNRFIWAITDFIFTLYPKPLPYKNDKSRTRTRYACCFVFTFTSSFPIGIHHLDFAPMWWMSAWRSTLSLHKQHFNIFSKLIWWYFDLRPTNVFSSFGSCDSLSINSIWRCTHKTCHTWLISWN